MNDFIWSKLSKPLVLIKCRMMGLSQSVFSEHWSIAYVWLILFFSFQLDGLMGSLNPKGVRELNLQMQLQKHYSKIWCVTFFVLFKKLRRMRVLEFWSSDNQFPNSTCWLLCSAAFQKRLKEMARSKEMSQKVVSDTPVLRRSVRVSVLPEDKKLPPFLGYVNKWK